MPIPNFTPIRIIGDPKSTNRTSRWVAKVEHPVMIIAGGVKVSMEMQRDFVYAGWFLVTLAPMPTHFVDAQTVQHAELPWCHVEWMSNPEIVGAKDILLVRATFEAGKAHLFHTHPGREEIIYVLEGTAEQWVGQEKRLLKPGEMAHIPRNTPHATYNNARDVLKFLAILSPVEAEGEFAVDVSDQEPWRSLVGARINSSM